MCATDVADGEANRPFSLSLASPTNTLMYARYDILQSAWDSEQQMPTRGVATVHSKHRLNVTVFSCNNRVCLW